MLARAVLVTVVAAAAQQTVACNLALCPCVWHKHSVNTTETQLPAELDDHQLAGALSLLWPRRCGRPLTAQFRVLCLQNGTRMHVFTGRDLMPMVQRSWMLITVKQMATHLPAELDAHQLACAVLVTIVAAAARQNKAHVIEVPALLLDQRLYPVVQALHVAIIQFPYKDVLKAGRVSGPVPAPRGLCSMILPSCRFNHQDTLVRGCVGASRQTMLCNTDISAVELSHRGALKASTVRTFQGKHAVS